jgi:hypothetical protein
MVVFAIENGIFFINYITFDLLVIPKTLTSNDHGNLIRALLL